MMFSIDLDVYFQTLIYQESRHYFWFALKGTVIQFKSLLWAFDYTPYLTRVFRLVSLWSHQWETTRLWYPDDWPVNAKCVYIHFVSRRGKLVYASRHANATHPASGKT